MCNMAIWTIILIKELATIFLVVGYLATIFFKIWKFGYFIVFFITNVATQSILVVKGLKGLHIAFECMLYNIVTNYSVECSNFKLLF